MEKYDSRRCRILLNNNTQFLVLDPREITYLKRESLLALCWPGQGNWIKLVEVSARAVSERWGNARSNVWYASLTPISDSVLRSQRGQIENGPLFDSSTQPRLVLSYLGPLMCVGRVVGRTTMLPVDQSNRDLPISAQRYDLPSMQNHDAWVEIERRV